MPRPSAAAWLLLAVSACAPPPAAAQAPAADPPGPYVVDLRGAMTGLPQSDTFYPPLPTGTRIPRRGFGFEVGGHVYPVRLGIARVGFGASVIQVRGTATTVSTSTQSFPDVTTTARLFAPQVSFNFGTRDGWSYVSAGYDAGRVRAEAGGTSPASKDRGGLSGYNAGAGARWFLGDHLGVGFDVRLHRVGAAGLFSATAGISVR